MLRYVVDCRHNDKLENQFLELGIWGKPCFAWVIENVISMRGGYVFVVLTQSAFIEDYCRMHYENVKICAELPDYEGITVWISGLAPCLSVETLQGAIEEFARIVQDDCVLLAAAKGPSYRYEYNDIPVYIKDRTHMEVSKNCNFENGQTTVIKVKQNASMVMILE